MKHRPVSRAGDTLRTFSIEDGKHLRGYHQDVGPAIERVRRIRDMHSTATKASNPNGWRHIGSVPMTMVMDWCQKNGYTFDQWARNEGGTPGLRYPNSRTGVKDKFLAWFLSRDYAKLHNQHVTTKREMSSIVVPEIGKSNHGTDELRGTEGGGS